MITSGNTIYWITTDENGEVYGVDVLKIVFIYNNHFIAENAEGHKGTIPRSELGTFAFLDPNTPRAILQLRKEELETKHLERLERMSAEISKLEEL